MLKRVLAVVVLAAAGAMVALVGAVSHRSAGWVGAVLSLLLVATSLVFAKTWQGWWGFGACALSLVAATIVAGQTGPGGGVLIADDAHGVTWLVGVAAIVVAVAAVPRRVLVGDRVAR